jgi:hypothetical protein
MARRDIWLLTNGIIWRVQARTGDADSRKWQHDYISEDDARAVIAGMMDRTGGSAEWRTLSGMQGRAEAPLEPRSPSAFRAQHSLASTPPVRAEPPTSSPRRGTTAPP